MRAVKSAAWPALSHWRARPLKVGAGAPGRRVSTLKKWWVLGATVLAGAGALLGPVVGAQTFDQFSNSTFECSSCDASSLVPLVQGSPAIAPWSVTQNSVDWINGSALHPYWQPPPGGGNSIDMNGTLNREPSGATSAAGAIAQTFSTTAGTTYLVSFEFSGNFNSPTCPGQGTQTMTVQASGTGWSSVPSSYTFTKPSDYSPQNMGWLTENYAFHTATAATTLTFTAASNNTTDCGPVLADVTLTPSSSPTTCTGSCTVNLQSTSTGTSAGITAASTGDGFFLQATFGSDYRLGCDSAVTGHFTADPLLVISYHQNSTAPNVYGSVTLTFPKKVVHEVPTNKGTPHMPVCVGANEPFPGSSAVRWTPTSPFTYQGLLYPCDNATHHADIKNAGNYPLNICVSSYSRVHGAERVVIQTNSFGDPMFW